jgi:hypothetical protein
MQFDQLKRREFITLRGGRVAPRGTSAATGDPGRRVHPHLIARDRSALCGKIRKQVAAPGSRLKQTGGLVRARRHLRAGDVVECEVVKIGVRYPVVHV